MQEIFSRFLEAAADAAGLPARPEVAERWEADSVLREFTVCGLAGHLLRALTTVEGYLDSPPPAEEPISAAARTMAPLGGGVA